MNNQTLFDVETLSSMEGNKAQLLMKVRHLTDEE